MGFSELLEMLRNGGDGIPDTIYDDIDNSFTASASEYENRIEALESEVSRLSAINEDLASSIPETNDDEPAADPETDDDDDTDGLGIDDLFSFESK